MRLFLLIFFISATLGLPSFPLREGYINDLTHTLPEKNRTYLEKQLFSLETQEGIQFVVVILPTLNKTPIEEISQQYFSHWQIGHLSRDSGILLLISLKEAQSYVDIGYGLDDRLTAATVLPISQNEINPLLQKNDLSQALEKGISSIFNLLGKSFGEEGVKSEPWFLTNTSLLIFLASIPLLILVARFAPTRYYFLSPIIGFGIGITQSLGLAIVLAALGVVMVAICFLLRYFLPGSEKKK